MLVVRGSRMVKDPVHNAAVELWPERDGSKRVTLARGNEVRVCVAANGKWAVIGGRQSGGLGLYDLRAGRLKARITPFGTGTLHDIRTLAVSADGIVSADFLLGNYNEVRVAYLRWNLKTNRFRVRQQYREHTEWFPSPD